jgi:prepilin-type N-terminal cleavage/methylation domain-containing protein
MLNGFNVQRGKYPKLRPNAESGFSLAELMVAMGIGSIVSILGSIVVLLVIDQMNYQENETARREVISSLARASKSPRHLRTALSGSVGCLAIHASASVAQPKCTAMTSFVPFAANIGGQMLTNADGVGCFRAKGERCAISGGGACPAECYLRALTEYRVVCPGAGSRTDCPSNQANILVRYSVKPETGVPAKNQFRPISSVNVIQARSLWGDVNKLSEGAAAVEVSTEPSKIARVCPAGSMMIGVLPSGEPNCEVLTDTNQRCAAGQVLAGYNIDASTKRIVAVCKDASCADLSGKKRAFGGFDITGNPICTVINPLDIVCNPGTTTAPGVFMTGVSAQTSTPICKRKTCALGEIYAGNNPDGSVRCAPSRGWIPGPSCALSNCSAPPTTTPPAVGTFYSSSSTPAVSLGYEGIPFITQWTNGEPRRAYRMTYKEFSGNGPSQIISGLFTDSKGAGVKTCLADGALPGGNHICYHTWLEVTRARGTCPANYTFSAPNTCIYSGPTCLAQETKVASGIGFDSSCPAACGSKYGTDPVAVQNAITSANCCCSPYSPGPEPSEQLGGGLESYLVRGVNFANGSGAAGTANCTSPPTPDSGNAYSYPSGLPVGSRMYDNYSASVRASCNYEYTR